MSRKCCCCIPVVVGAAILGLIALLFCAAELAVLIPYLAQFDIETFNPIQQNLNDIYYVFEDLLQNCVTEASCPFNMTTDFKQTIMSEVKSYESTVLMGAAVESGVYGLTALLMVIGIACKVGLYLILLAGVFYNVKNGSSLITSKSSSENLSNHNKHLCLCCLPDKT